MLVKVKDWNHLYNIFGDNGYIEIDQFQYTEEIEDKLLYHRIIEVKKDSCGEWYDIEYDNGWDKETFDTVDVIEELRTLMERNSLDKNIFKLLIEELINEDKDVTFENNKLLKYLISVKFLDCIELVIELDYVDETLDDEHVIRDLLKIYNPDWSICTHLLRFVYINMAELLTIHVKDKIKIYHITKTDEEAIELVRALDAEKFTFVVDAGVDVIIKSISRFGNNDARCFNIDSKLNVLSDFNLDKVNFSQNYFWIEHDDYFIDILNKRKNTKVDEVV